MAMFGNDTLNCKILWYFSEMSESQCHYCVENNSSVFGVC
jgi:hypothetical protein